jgi:hypothetical protein
MPLFIVFSLTLCFLVQTASPSQDILAGSLLMYISLAIAIISIFGSVFKKIWVIMCYDIFSSSTLLVWFCYWKPSFKDDSPIFFFYPLYFALFTAFVSLFFISQRHKIDEVSFGFMQSLAKKSLIQPWVVMVFVLGSLAFQENFTLYPVMMTLLIIRFTLASCLDGRDH